VPEAVAASARAAGGLPAPYLWAALAVVVAVRLAWLMSYLVLARRNLVAGFRLLTSELYQAPTDTRRAEIHQSVAAEVNRLADTCLVVGALALAAWAALFAVADQPAGSQVRPTTRALLVLGAAVLIAAPVFFRVPDLYLSYLGRSSALFTGLTAVGLAFASLGDDLLRGVLRIAIPLAAAIVLVARDLVDVSGEIRGLAAEVQPVLARHHEMPDL
jgi:hypothetical protein